MINLVHLACQLSGAINQALNENENYVGAISLIGHAKEHFDRMVPQEGDKVATDVKNLIQGLYVSAFVSLLEAS